jgi:hypothetical protein
VEVIVTNFSPTTFSCVISAGQISAGLARTKAGSEVEESADMATTMRYV